MDVDDGKLQREITNGSARRQCGMAAAHEAYVRARAANIDSDNVVESCLVCGLCGANHSRRRPGQRGMDRLTCRCWRTNDTAPGLHDQQRHVMRNGFSQPRVEGIQIAADVRGHVRIEHRGYRALVLAELREDLR